jgi:hypothetical protein
MSLGSNRDFIAPLCPRWFATAYKTKIRACYESGVVDKDGGPGEYLGPHTLGWTGPQRGAIPHGEQLTAISAGNEQTHTTDGR